MVCRYSGLVLYHPLQLNGFQPLSIHSQSCTFTLTFKTESQPGISVLSWERAPLGSSGSSSDFLNMKEYHFRKSGKLLSQQLF